MSFIFSSSDFIISPIEGYYFDQLKQKHCALYLQNDLIIQIMTECSEIDNLRKQVDDAKMKLATEIKVY